MPLPLLIHQCPYFPWRLLPLPFPNPGTLDSHQCLGLAATKRQLCPWGLQVMLVPPTSDLGRAPAPSSGSSPTFLIRNDNKAYVLPCWVPCATLYSWDSVLHCQTAPPCRSISTLWPGYPLWSAWLDSVFLLSRIGLKTEAEI